MEGLYYPCSGNKGADQLRGYRDVFAYAKSRFSHNEAHFMVDPFLASKVLECSGLFKSTTDGSK